MKIKELLKEYISEELFNDLAGFVEELYLMDYEYLVLMARKFYNLFYVFHEINCEKYKKMDIPYESKGTIVSNRALPLLMDVLNSGYHKIIIGDDIIIHGRGIRDLYKRLKNLNPKLDIAIETYIINNDDTSVYEDIIDKIHCYYEVSQDKWRDVSDRIVTSFYMAGRPYISYLPYFVLDISWDKLIEKIDVDNSIIVNNYDLNYYCVDLLVYYGEEFEKIQAFSCCNIAAMRFYNYQKAGKLLAVPYFCAEVMEQKCFNDLSDKLRKKVFTAKYLNKVRKNNNADSMRVMEFEYTMSLFLAKKLFDKWELNIREWPREIEKSTFSELLVNVASFEEVDSDEGLQLLMDYDAIINPISPLLAPNEKELLEAYENLKEKYSNQFRDLKNLKYWKGDDKDYIRKYIEELLLENGDLDDVRCTNLNIEDKSRLMGLPVSFVIDDSALFWATLYDSLDKTYYKRKVFAEIIAAIDSGKGSIVINQVGTSENDRRQESLLHAGEQNYKYYETSAFPYMYGMMLIEYEMKKRNLSADVFALKKRFQEKFDAYLTIEGIAFIKNEQDKLSLIPMMEKYGSFLLNVYYKYVGDEVLEMAKRNALEVISEC